MTRKTIRTSVGDFLCIVDDNTTDDDIANKVARRLGYKAAWVTNSSGARGSFEAKLGSMTDPWQMSVSRTITIYR